MQNAEAEISANQAEIEALEIENAELLFYSLTNKDFGSLTEEDVMIEEIVEPTEESTEKPVIEEVVESTEEPAVEEVVESTEE